MNKLMHRTIEWLAFGGAFAAVVNSAGCARMKSIAGLTARPAPATQPAQTVTASSDSGALFENTGLFEPQTPVVNVFGELDGNPPANPASGEVGFQQHTFVDEGFDGDVNASPDGRWLIFASTRHNDRPDIYIQKVDGLSVTQLTSDGADDAYPTFAPDGKRVAFSSTRNGSWDIYLMDADGRNITQVTSGPSQDLHPSFSPDGSRLIYCSSGRSGQWELWTVDLLTLEKKMVGYGLFPVWSPEKGSNKVAYQRARQRGSRWFSLWTLELMDGEARRITEVAASSNAAIVSPTWSPDGRRLAFSTIVSPTAESKARGHQDIWVVNADGANRRRITDGTGTNLSPTWSTDGRIYFISDRAGSECVWSAFPGATSSQVANTAMESK